MLEVLQKELRRLTLPELLELYRRPFLFNWNISAGRSSTQANDEMPESEILARCLCESQWSIDGACLAAEICDGI